MTEKASPTTATRVREVVARPRIVIAAVRPSRPNPAVIRAAADLAEQEGTSLLVIGALRVVYIDCTQAAHFTALLVEAASAELSASTAELLSERQLHWAIDVVLDHPARRVNQLAEKYDVRAVVAGHTVRRRPWLRKIGSQPALVVTA